MFKNLHLILLLAAVPALGQAPVVSLGGVQLRLGMAKDAVLASYSEISGLQLLELTPSFVLLTDRDAHEKVTLLGQLDFGPTGQLAKITVAHRAEVTSEPGNKSRAESVVTFAKSLYTAVKLAGEGNRVEVRATTSDDANNPWYRVHLVYRDREIVIETFESGGIKSASIETHFPSMLVGPPKKGALK